MRRFIALIVLTFMIFSLASCHGKLELAVENGDGTVTDVPKVSYDVPDSFDTEKKIEISFWAKNDSNETQQMIYKKAAEDFQKLYPNVTVKVRLLHDYNLIYRDVITNIATDTTPNVCITYPDHIATYMEGEGTVVPLDDFIAHDKYGLGGSELKYDSPKLEEVIPQFLNECKIESNYYALPFMRSTEACYVNKTFVEKLGFTLPETLTWDFVWEVSEAATKKNEDGTFALNGQKVLLPFMYKSTDNMMIQMLKQRGAGYSSEYGEVFLFNDTTEEIIYTVGEHAKSGAFDTFERSSYPANFLNAGRCIFAVDSTGGATWMGAEAPNIDIPEENRIDFETVVMTIPQFDTENPKMISQGPSVCIFNKDDPQVVLASWLFTQFLLTNEVQIAYSQTEGYAPVTSKALDSADYKDYMSREGEDNELYYSVKLQATKLLLDNVDNTFVTPVFNGSVSVRNAAGYLIDTVNKGVRRKQVVNDDYIAKLYAETKSLYKLDQIKISEKAPENAVENTDNIQEDIKLPVESVALFVILGICWVSMGMYFVANLIKNKKNPENH